MKTFLAFTLLYAWLLVHRVRLEQLEERSEGHELDVALAERRAEADELVGTGTPGTAG